MVSDLRSFGFMYWSKCEKNLKDHCYVVWEYFVIIGTCSTYLTSALVQYSHVFTILRFFFCVAHEFSSVNHEGCGTFLKIRIVVHFVPHFFCATFFCDTIFCDTVFCATVFFCHTFLCCHFCVTVFCATVFCSIIFSATIFLLSFFVTPYFVSPQKLVT